MPKAGADGESRSAIRIDMKMSADVSGHSKRETPDGLVDGPSSQRFVRIDGSVRAGDWLINPATRETHKVLESGADSITFQSKDGAVTATVEEVRDVLLRVVDEWPSRS